MVATFQDEVLFAFVVLTREDSNRFIGVHLIFFPAIVLILKAKDHMGLFFPDV